MHIRRARAEDAASILPIMDDARSFQRSCGFFQWHDGHPSMEEILDDISAGACYVLTDDEGIVGSFSVFYGADPSYALIEDGSWMNPTDRYLTVHRVAVADRARGRGAAGRIFQYAYDMCPGLGALSLRVDTHHQNKAMRKAAEKFGFTLCGVIYVEDGTPRAAYEKIYKEGEE